LLREHRHGKLRRVNEIAVVDDVTDAADALARSSVVVVRNAFLRADCARWSDAVLAAESDWTADFGGEQYALGRAFYTHHEEQRSRAYFEAAEASDATVERHLPGLQQALRSVVGALTGGHVRARPGFCGPGVHIFPAGEKVAREGGVVHFDVEGLTPHHLAQRLPALTAVLMLQPPDRGGGLRVWDATYVGQEEPGPGMLTAPTVLAGYERAHLLVIDSYRLHQIQPFEGARHRISATVHAAEISRGVWDTWF